VIGHAHLYAHRAAKPREIVIGNGGAPPNSTLGFGFALVSQRGDGTLDVDMIDYMTGLTDALFHFRVNADGSLAP
jgi:hypothetical protein